MSIDIAKVAKFVDKEEYIAKGVLYNNEIKHYRCGFCFKPFERYAQVVGHLSVCEDRQIQMGVYRTHKF